MIDTSIATVGWLCGLRENCVAPGALRRGMVSVSPGSMGMDGAPASAIVPSPRAQTRSGPGL